MPLHEIPSNINNPGTEDPQARTSSLAVQRMLKSATEFGDIGILAPRPLRLHRSETHSSHRSRSTIQTSRTQYIQQQRYRPPRQRPREDWQRPGYASDGGSLRGVPQYRYRQHLQAASLRSLPSPRRQTRRVTSTFRAIPPHISDSHVQYAQDGRHSSMTSVSSNPTSSVGSIVPYYYDYSESFYGDAALHPYLHHNDTILEGEQEKPFNRAELSSDDVLGMELPDIAELATPHHRRPSEQSSHTIKWQTSTENTHSSHTSLQQTSSEELTSPELSAVSSRHSTTEVSFQSRKQMATVTRYRHLLQKGKATTIPIMTNLRSSHFWISISSA